MAYQRMSDGRLHKTLKGILRRMWRECCTRFADMADRIGEMLRRLANSVRVANLEYILETRGRNDLVGLAYDRSFREGVAR